MWWLSERKGEVREIVTAEAEEPRRRKAPGRMGAVEESLTGVKGEGLAGEGAAKPKPKRKPAAKSSSSSRRKSSGSKSGSKSKTRPKSKSKS